MKKHYRKENDCLNCGTILEGKYCHKCGQENLELKENFGHMMSHAISDYFHFDHLFFHTLKPLLFKPGFLTNEYMAGKRVQYLHPVKMYIFISIVYFLLLFQSGHEVVTINKAKGKNPVNTQKMTDSLGKEIASASKEIDKNTNLSAQQKKAIKDRLPQAKAITKKGVVKITDYEKDDRGPNTWFRPRTEDTSYKQYIANQQKLPEEEQDKFLEKQWNKKTFDYREKYGPSAKEVFLDELKHNTPKMMFLLLPLFALILRFAFWKNKKYYVEHMIFSFHFHCFLFLFLGVIMLLQRIIPESWETVIGWIKAVATFYIMWYIYRSLRVVYHRGRFRTVTKIIGMSFMYFFALTFCICLLFFVTAII
jgi:hypothetical protein